MNCYGKYSVERKQCSSCKLLEWCCNAGNPEVISDRMVDFDKIKTFITGKDFSSTENADTEKENWEKIYSKGDLLEVVGFMASLDFHTLKLLDEKIQDPVISFSEIARKRGISRQAVHKQVLKKCNQIPELDNILRNRKNNIKKQADFMEEVCKIRKQTLKKKLLRPRNAFNCSKTLTCLSQSLDLSRMSIFKGGAISKSDLNS
ncbi:AsnC family protein [Lentisphaerota bacterium ZTH]|nr:AsnC family protein [Lentisphaerota bacterium]WET06492.1 AsnC family protein [Lentisphaerota bacterium ZTH]